MDEWLQIQGRTAAPAETCDECALLSDSVLPAILKIRSLLSERSRAASAGLIDDVNFLEQQTDIDDAFLERNAAVDAYVQHAEKKHGMAEHHQSAPTNWLE